MTLSLRQPVADMGASAETPQIVQQYTLHAHPLTTAAKTERQVLRSISDSRLSFPRSGQLVSRLRGSQTGQDKFDR